MGSKAPTGLRELYTREDGDRELRFEMISIACCPGIRLRKSLEAGTAN
jgi:hypothetical protein